jgi:hypothetical protein
MHRLVYKLMLAPISFKQKNTANHKGSGILYNK